MSTAGESTHEDHGETGSVDRRPEPGLVAIFAGGAAMTRVLPLTRGRMVLGRPEEDGLPTDTLASRRHAEVALGATTWRITDLGSRNGTFVNGKRIGEAAFDVPRGRSAVIRIGDTLYLTAEDLTPYREHGVIERAGAVVGPTSARVLELVRDAGRTRTSLLITGESGTGKELAARAYHTSAGSGDAPFLAVNCAAVPESVAERLLFGSTRGAFSGATEAEGYVRAADGGTLFLDEVGELPLAVQAKLLRVLETGEVLPLGASTAVTVTTRFCFATLRNLRALVAEDRFRPDLFYRVARTSVTLPPLRERIEEIPLLALRELAATDATLAAHSSLVEACLVRPWPGNVRELIATVRSAGASARRAGKCSVRASHLPPEPDAVTPPAPASVSPATVTVDALRSALAINGGNLAAAARSLGLHRSQMYRLLREHGLER